MKRPAEVAGAGLGVAGLVYGVVDGNWTASVVAVCNFVPAVVTFIVSNGGLKGLLDKFWRGK